MCGIAGIVDTSGEPIRSEWLLAMSAVLAHRGPDDEGYTLIAPMSDAGATALSFSGSSSPIGVQQRYPLLRPSHYSGEGASIGLAHRRFSIVDLSDAGHQPFFDAEGSCCVVFNGEIYNYVELRDQLAREGAVFRTTSDTEVLVEAYKRWGTGCFAHFNGAWALAIYDFHQRRLILSRDRLGKRPLYWTRCGPRIYFASEIKALLRVPEVSAQRRVNEPALLRWLVRGEKDLGNSTLFQGVESLPAASWTTVGPDFPGACRTFWEVPRERLSENALPVADAVAGLRPVLEDAVRLRMRADVPVCVELSGGMDSSTLLALAATQHPEQVISYTVRFPEAAWNEEPFARIVADRYGADYRVLDPPVANFWEQIHSFTYLEEEPYHAPNLQTNQEIWNHMRAEGMKVSLNGAAGDEVFAGYGHHYHLAQLEALRNGRARHFVRNAAFHSESRNALSAGLKPFWSLAKAGLQWAGGTERALPPLQTSWGLAGETRKYVASAPLTLSAALRRDMIDTRLPYWLRSGDRGFMGIPLEVRAPFLDYRVVEYAFRLPVTYLIRDGWHKWILRKAMEGLLPETVLWRKRKLGFPFPYQRFCSESRSILKVLLDNADNPYLDAKRLDHSLPEWGAVSFLLWYELFFKDNVALFQTLEDLARGGGARRRERFEPRYFSLSAVGTP